MIFWFLVSVSAWSGFMLCSSCPSCLRVSENSCQNLFPYPVNPVHLVHVLWPFPSAKIRANSRNSRQNFPIPQHLTPFPLAANFAVPQTLLISPWLGNRPRHDEPARLNRLWQPTANRIGYPSASRRTGVRLHFWKIAKQCDWICRQRYKFPCIMSFRTLLDALKSPPKSAYFYVTVVKPPFPSSR
jgi:hypothetical protein